jgi:hypothetical protein
MKFGFEPRNDTQRTFKCSQGFRFTDPCELRQGCRRMTQGRRNRTHPKSGMSPKKFFPIFIRTMCLCQNVKTGSLVISCRKTRQHMRIVDMHRSHPISKTATIPGPKAFEIWATSIEICLSGRSKSCVVICALDMMACGVFVVNSMISCPSRSTRKRYCSLSSPSGMSTPSHLSASRRPRLIQGFRNQGDALCPPWLGGAHPFGASAGFARPAPAQDHP